VERAGQPDPGTGASLDEAAGVAGFHEELRRRNVPILIWSAAIFIPAYVAWTVFDWFLAREHWASFLALRLSAAAINTAIVLAVRRPALRRYTWEAFWAWLFVFGAFIAPMLPVVGDSYAPYVMGFTIILYGAGLLPFWRGVWAVSLIAAVIATVPIAFLMRTSTVSTSDIVGASSFVFTAAGLAIVMATFKYRLALREWSNRQELASTVRSETRARLEAAEAKGELERALHRLQDLDQLKNRFFANVSHELRTPLTLILAPLETLAGRPELGRHLDDVRVIRRNAERLLRLIDDLLDLSRLDAGGLRLNLADLDPRGIAASVVEVSRPAAEAKSIDLRYRADEPRRKILADAHRIEIVLTNLVGNALKYTPDGGRVDIAVRDLDDGVEIRVADTGEGIAAEDLPQVFDRFFQVAGTDRRRQGGVGIGLALAKELVELHGGKVDVASEVGRGTTFTVFLPFGDGHVRPDIVEKRREFQRDGAPRRRVEDDLDAERAAASGGVGAGSGIPTPSPYGDVPRARIVVAEDQAELRSFIAGLLGSDHHVVAVEDGETALEAVRRERPDLVVSDVMMPRMSGTELCRAIKSDPALRSTPVILLTARVGSEATLEGYAHGADDFVAKPFHPRVLLARVRAQLRLRALALTVAEQEKLAVVGTLAAGVLHEVRNPVNAILNAARVLAKGTSGPEASQRLLAVVQDAAQRVQGITEALDAHARPADGGAPGAFDVRAGLDATLRLLEHRTGDVAVRRDYATERSVLAPAGPINQVFLNLIDNAVRSGARTLWVSVADADDRVRVRVADDGPGVPPEIASRVFDPFFTTRPPGQGSGLGLYLSKQIVEQNGGTLTLTARDGGGAAFVVDLPAIVPGRREP